MSANNILLSLGFATIFVGLVMVMVGIARAPMRHLETIKMGDPGQVLVNKDGRFIWVYPEERETK